MRTHPGFAVYVVLGMLLCLTGAQPVSAPTSEPVAASPGRQWASVAIMVGTGVSCHPVLRTPRSEDAGQQVPAVYPGPAEWKAFHDRNRRAGLLFRDRGELSVEVAGAHIGCVRDVVGLLRQLREAGILDARALVQLLPGTGLTEVVVRAPHFAGWTGLACLVGSWESDTSAVVIPRNASGGCL